MCASTSFGIFEAIHSVDLCINPIGLDSIHEREQNSWIITDCSHCIRLLSRIIHFDNPNGQIIHIYIPFIGMYLSCGASPIRSTPSLLPIWFGAIWRSRNNSWTHSRRTSKLTWTVNWMWLVTRRSPMPYRATSRWMVHDLDLRYGYLL